MSVFIKRIAEGLEAVNADRPLMLPGCGTDLSASARPDNVEIRDSVALCEKLRGLCVKKARSRKLEVGSAKQEVGRKQMAQNGVCFNAARLSDAATTKM